jgi:RNA polymerase sigma-70 factor (ECF subfamily)
LRFVIRRAQAGDPRAFKSLVEEYRARIYRWALVRTGDEDDAEDATQEALVRLHQGLPRFRLASSFETWLYAITRSAAADMLRSRKRKQAVKDRYARLGQMDGSTEEDPIDRLALREAAALVRRFLEDLPPKQREAFDLVDLQEMKPSEAAALAGSNPATLRTHLLRARRALRGRLLERQLPDGESR